MPPPDDWWRPIAEQLRRAEPEPRPADTEILRQERELTDALRAASVSAPEVHAAILSRALRRASGEAVGGVVRLAAAVDGRSVDLFVRSDTAQDWLKAVAELWTRIAPDDTAPFRDAAAPHLDLLSALQARTRGQALAPQVRAAVDRFAGVVSETGRTLREHGLTPGDDLRAWLDRIAETAPDAAAPAADELAALYRRLLDEGRIHPDDAAEVATAEREAAAMEAMGEAWPAAAACVGRAT